MAVRTWNPEEGITMDTVEILRNIEETHGLEGVTFLGGEPFEQAEPMVEIAQACRKRGLSIIAFSGFTLEELRQSKDKHVGRLLNQIDLLIDGPYRQELRDFNRPWVGSINQEFHFLTERYQSDLVKHQKNRLEIRISSRGEIIINGMTDFEKAIGEESDGTI